MADLAASPASATNYIALDNVTKRFPRGGQPPLTVIEGLTLNIERGSLVSILGPSGCGKSTLLNLMNGLDAVSAGSITINGSRIGPKEHSGVRIGVAFQTPRLLNWRTVHDNVTLPLTVNGLSKREAKERADRYLALVGLSEFASYYPLRLSGGMQQRVSLARGLALEPDLLLADEPFSALDELTADRLRGELLELWRITGRTILFVTHNIREAVFLSSRLVVVTARPCRVHLDMEIDVPHPRDPEDARLFEIEKQVSAEFRKMEQATTGQAH
jgi:NitT/TauT family transport system ATP-binding protein